MESLPDYSTNLQGRVFSMLQTGRRADCKFLVGTEFQKEVEAHRLILASMSPVFDAMFYGAMPEIQTTIPIPDIEPTAFSVMLEYIYTDDIKLCSLDDAIKLYYAANKYMLTNLENICITYIESNLTRNNVCRAYEFGSMFEKKNLMKKCLNFIQAKEIATHFFNNNLVLQIRLNQIQLSTLVTIFSLDICTKYSALFLFKIANLYIKIQNKLMCTNFEPDSVQTESSMSNDIIVNEDSEEVLEVYVRQDKETKLAVSKEKPNIHVLLQKIHFLTLTPKQFADGPGTSSLLTMSEKYAILMNIASNETNVPMPSGFSTYKHKVDIECEKKIRR